MVGQHAAPIVRGQRQRRSAWDAKRIIVPVIGLWVDEDALRLAGEVARRNKGVVYAVHVIEVDRTLPLDAHLEPELERGEALLEEVKQLAKKAKFNVDTEVLQARDAGPAVVEEVRERSADLIVMGMSYKRHFGEFSMGHAVPFVLKNAPCPVWVCREEMTPEGM
jgi:nucleotide-binding universal stress UspA family protein